MNRSREEILNQILDVCSEEPISRTKIVYQVNLNFKTVKPYLDLLICKGLLEAYEGKLVLYKTSPKGTWILEQMNLIQFHVSIC